MVPGVRMALLFTVTDLKFLESPGGLSGGAILCEKAFRPIVNYKFIPEIG